MNPNSLIASFLSLCNLLVVLALIWASYQGFELSDESFYILGYTNLDPNTIGASFHLVYQTFFSVFEFNLIQIRFLRLFLTFMVIVVAYSGLQKILSIERKSERLILFNIVSSGFLLSYAWGPITLSYNSMSSIIVGLILGIWLHSLIKQTRLITNGLVLILGFLYMLLFFVKISNVAILPIMILATLFWIKEENSWSKLKLRSTLIQSLLFLFGAFASWTVLSGGFSHLNQTLQLHLEQSFGVLNSDSHSADHLMDVYIKNALLVFETIKFEMLIITLCASTYFVLSILYSAKIKKTHFWILELVTVIVILFTIMMNKYWIGGADNVYQVINLYLLITFGMIVNLVLNRKNIHFPMLVGVTLVPILGAAGTNNGLSANVLFYAVFIFIAIYMLLRKTEIVWYRASILVVMSLLSASQVISGTFIHPYRQETLFNDKTELTEPSLLNGIHVTNDVWHLQEELRFLNDLEAEYIFAYSHQRGMILLTNKKPFSLAWYNENYVESMCTDIRESNIDPRNIVFLIPKELPLEAEVLLCLQEKGIRLKTDFTVAKHISYHDMVKKKDLTLNVFVNKDSYQKEG